MLQSDPLTTKSESQTWSGCSVLIFTVKYNSKAHEVYDLNQIYNVPAET